MIESISQYRVLKKIGEGGMGEVYLAQDTRLNRTVAIKILPAAVSHDRERLSRFLQEARAAAVLQHPHIAHVYEVGEENGINFIVMEYVQGQTLDARIRSHPLDLKETITLAAQVADALLEAHEKGITHRDIKPSNIIVTPRAGVKLLDFGLAKVATVRNVELDSELPTALKTTTGAVIGTVTYMSPEQALGRKVDHRSDIFSLGIVIYEMVTGRKPFVGKTTTETIDRIVHAQPQAIARFNYDVPTELERIVRKALEKEPEHRYQSAGDLLTDLRTLQRDLVSTDRPDTTTRRKYASRPLVYALIALAILVLTGVVAYRLLVKNQPIDSVVVLPFTNEGGDPNTDYLSDGISENLINRLSQLHDLRVVPRNTAFRYRGQQVDAQAVGQTLGVRAVILGRVVQRGDILIIQAELIDVQNQSQLWGDQYQRNATDLLALQTEIASAIAEKLRLRLNESERIRLSKRDTENPEAYQFYLRGRYFWGKRTESGIRKGLENFKQAIDLDPAYARAYAGLADCYNFLGAFGIALMPPGEAMPKARAAATRALEIDDSLADAHTSYAFVRFYYDWDWAAAEKEFQRAIELDPSYAPAHQWYSHLLMARGKTDEAITRAKHAVQIDPLSLAANMNVGWQYHWSRQYDSAITHLQSLAEMDPNFEQGFWGLGLAQEGKGAVEDAIESFKKSSSLSGEKPLYLAALGHAYAVAGKRSGAISIRDDLESRSTRTYVPPYWMATLYVGLGDKDRAFSWLERAYQERSGGLVWLRVDPRLDPLRQDPRFAALAQRIELAS